MTAPDNISERQRILEENARRRADVDPALYASDNPAERFAVTTRIQAAEASLIESGGLPQPTHRCLEVGVGSSGWLPVFERWGIPAEKQFGVDLDLVRLAEARTERPGVSLAVADGSILPIADGAVDLVVTSTVFSSILDTSVQNALAAEITRSLAPQGALVLYDLRVNNPRNPNVRGLPAQRIRTLFPELSGSIRSIGLAPPIARRVLSAGTRIAGFLEAVPLLRSHVLAVLRKPSPSASGVLP